MARTEHKSKETAKALYLKGVPVERILELTAVARQTLSRWINQEGWKELKACYGMTREEITHKSTNIIHYVEAFIRFEDWLMEHRKEYPELPDEVVMILHRLHDDFISPFFIKK